MNEWGNQVGQRSQRDKEKGRMGVTIRQKIGNSPEIVDYVQGNDFTGLTN